MRSPRVYHPDRLQIGRDATLDEASSHHLGRVLRMKVGDDVVLFDGAGGEYRALIRGMERSGVRVRVEAFEDVERESGLEIGLVQAVSAGERMEFTLQKSVELGAAWIQPILARRSKVRLEGERAERRVAHWQRVVNAACEQCGRNRVPRVRPLLEFTAWLGEPAAARHRLMLQPAADRRLSECGPLRESVELLAGSEGGLADEETALARHYGFVPVRLGPRVLRTETAALAALAALQALWGDF
jgi:16S rRNA (uracil1498-N3)-methyltransferase